MSRKRVRTCHACSCWTTRGCYIFFETLIQKDSYCVQLPDISPRTHAHNKSLAVNFQDHLHVFCLKCWLIVLVTCSHADGSIKFWDASAGTLQVLYKLKTAKVFEKPKSRSTESEEDPFAIQIISVCAESRKMCIAGASSHVILFKFKKPESCEEITVRLHCVSIERNC